MKRRKDGIDVQGKVPSFPLYPADLERELQLLSLAAAGLWMRLLLRMHFSPNRGYLEHVTGIPMDTSDIANLVGKPVKDIARLIAEMERVGTFSRDDRGCIYNRRMARDTEISRKRKAAGITGQEAAGRDESGRFVRADERARSENTDGQNDGQITVLSSSSSFSSSPSGNKPPTPLNAEPPDRFDYAEHFQELWATYPAKGRTKLVDCQRMYCEAVAPDPYRLHECLMVPIREGGKWAVSDNWARGFVFSLHEYIRNRRDLEDPEPYRGEPNKNTTSRISAIEKSRQSLEEVDLSDVETAY